MVWRIFAILVAAMMLVAPVVAQDEDGGDVPEEESPVEDGGNPGLQILPLPGPTSAPIVIVVTATPPPAPPPVVEESEQIRQALQVQVTGIRLELQNTSAQRFRDRIYIIFDATNTGPADIRAFTGIIVFRDLFDRQLKQVRLTYDSSPLPAGQSRTVSTMYFELNQFIADDQRIKNSDLSNMQVSFEVASILFSDGRRIGTAR